MEEEKNGLQKTDALIEENSQSEKKQEPELPRMESVEPVHIEPEKRDEEEPSSNESDGETEKKSSQPESLGRPWQGESQEAHSGVNEAKVSSGNRGMSSASLVMGILSLLCCCCGYAGIAFGALGIIFALLSRQEKPMDTQAKIGLALSCVGVALAVISVLLLLLFNAADMLEISTDLGRR